MKRDAFSLIELVFVIVIIAIMSVVALPKFVGINESAQDAKIGELVATLNSAVGPNLMAKATVASNGSVNRYMLTQVPPENRLLYYMEIPSNFRVSNTAFRCDEANATRATSVGLILEDQKNKLYIFCRDGNLSMKKTIRFWYAKTSTPTAEYNVSKSMID